MLRNLIRFPILKRWAPSIGIRVLKLLKRNKGFYKINNILFYLDFLDPIDRKIILYKEYEHDAVSFLEEKFTKHSISNFLDIGANSGYFSFYFANKFNNLKVKAFEPNIDAFEKFKKTLIKNSFDDVEIFNYGLSDIEKKVKMITWYKHGHAKTNLVILEDHFNTNNSKIYETDLKVGDEVLNFKNEKLCIKIDVEGHEYNVIQGLKNLLKENKVILQIEIENKNFKKTDNFLNDIGYKTFNKFMGRGKWISNFYYKNFK